MLACWNQSLLIFAKRLWRMHLEDALRVQVFFFFYLFIFFLFSFCFYCFLFCFVSVLFCFVFCLFCFLFVCFCFSFISRKAAMRNLFIFVLCLIDMLKSKKSIFIRQLR